MGVKGFFPIPLGIPEELDADRCNDLLAGLVSIVAKLQEQERLLHDHVTDRFYNNFPSIILLWVWMA